MGRSALRRNTNCGAHPVVRDKFDVGVLPFDRPVKLWAGFGSGGLCTVCGRALLPVQAEYALQYDVSSTRVSDSS